MLADLKEIAEYFKMAYEALVMAKCRVTARAYFNLGQEKLDALEQHPDPDVASTIRKLRAEVRSYLDAVPRPDRTLRYRLEAYKDFWSNYL